MNAMTWTPTPAASSAALPNIGLNQDTPGLADWDAAITVPGHLAPFDITFCDMVCAQLGDGSWKCMFNSCFRCSADTKTWRGIKTRSTCESARSPVDHPAAREQGTVSPAKTTVTRTRRKFTVESWSRSGEGFDFYGRKGEHKGRRPFW